MRELLAVVSHLVCGLFFVILGLLFLAPVTDFWAELVRCSGGSLFMTARGPVDVVDGCVRVCVAYYRVNVFVMSDLRFS